MNPNGGLETSEPEKTEKTNENMGPVPVEFVRVGLCAHRGVGLSGHPNFTELYLEHQVPDCLHILGACRSCALKLSGIDLEI